MVRVSSLSILQTSEIKKMITDIHRHFVPYDFFHYLQSNDQFPVKVKRSEGDSIDVEIRGIHFGLNKTFFELPRHLELMNDQNVDRGILSLATPFIDYWLDEKFAVEFARQYNDALVASTSSRGKEFGAWAFLPMQDPARAAEELRRCVTELGCVGGHVATNVRGVYLHDPQFTIVFQAAVDLDVPLFVHPADPLGKERLQEYELMVVAGYLCDSTINILKMVCSGFLDKWPKLKLVCAHTGAFSLPLRARMQREVDTNPRLASNLQASIGDYLRRLYYDTVCFEPAMLRFAASIVPTSHLLLGSDAPFPLAEPNPVAFVSNALPECSDTILRENFSRLTGE
jgi:aminocarboxymuconate-semialdehyde decarboxylase